jgi:hypothetical protein
MRPSSKGFSSRINKKKENIIYFYSLSVNYNNRSPVVDNDSQDGIHCRRWAVIIYELTNNILKNNTISRLYFIMTRIMLFSYGYARQIINNRKNAADSLAILMAMRIRWYGAECITQYGRSSATLDATGCHHQASIHPLSPQPTPWNRLSKLAFKRHEMDPLLSSSK